MKKFISTLIILSIKIYFFECHKEILYKDLSTSIVIDEQEANLEAYHSKENEEILNENNAKKFRHLKWFSIGYPVIIESESKISKNKSLFHFTKKGFYVSIQLLTNGQKRIIINEIKKVHNISVEMSQIIEMKPDNFECELELNGDIEEDSSVLRGKVKSFKFAPFKIEFEASNDEIIWMKKFLSERVEDIIIMCDMSLEEINFKNFKLGIQSYKPNFDCNSKGSNICLNNGTCLYNGTCNCSIGFDGNNCEIYKGCAFGGSLTCLNNGSCLSTGFCECIIGYTGMTCLEYKGCNYGGVFRCFNGGKCLPTGLCECEVGYAGITCSEYKGCNIGETLTCLNNGSCLSNGFCECELGFVGLNCSEYRGCNIKGPLACLNNGKCLTSGVCDCTSGYAGVTCAQNVTLIKSVSKPNLVNVFNYFKLNKSIENCGEMGFAMIRSNQTLYYVFGWNSNMIYTFNENWKNIFNKSFQNPAYAESIGNYLYITGGSSIWKTDSQLNIIIKYNRTYDATYRGIYHNSTNDLLYVATYYSLEGIQIFDLALNLKYSISTSPYLAWSISGHSNQLFVGTSEGKILLIVNNQIINQFNGCNGNPHLIVSMVFDEFSHVSTLCENKQLYLYHINGTYGNKNIATLSNPRYIGFDSKLRLVLINTLISIYD